MLSILIPIYNFSCFDLARELSAQASAANVPFEIICIDDASCFYKKENRAIRDLPHTVYIELIENIGRSRIRNLLVSKAQYDILLFLDCDSKIANSDYIKRYLEEFRRADILSGGTLYEPCPPTDLNYALHWTFGSKRESPPDENQRKTFTSNNFIIKKTIIEK
ncbi:MAG: glycosyltransferase, partial [Dysgonamonadaceae bacterium]|nr:glycosyltransferase [Dysgonamonadaceae bacterium]